MALIGFILTVAAGWFGWSGWFAIPLGALLFFGSLRAIPEKAHRVSRLGIPIYPLGALVLMKTSGWLHTAIS